MARKLPDPPVPTPRPQAPPDLYRVVRGPAGWRTNWRGVRWPRRSIQPVFGPRIRIPAPANDNRHPGRWLVRGLALLGLVAGGWMLMR